jgi:hypothetical protein
VVLALDRRSESGTLQRTVASVPLPERELVVFCPGCKALEVLWFANGHLIPTRKFIQIDGRVYHDCGFGEPCRLFRHS